MLDVERLVSVMFSNSIKQHMKFGNMMKHCSWRTLKLTSGNPATGAECIVMCFEPSWIYVWVGIDGSSILIRPLTNMSSLLSAISNYHSPVKTIDYLISFLNMRVQTPTYPVGFFRGRICVSFMHFFGIHFWFRPMITIQLVVVNTEYSQNKIFAKLQRQELKGSPLRSTGHCLSSGSC